MVIAVGELVSAWNSFCVRMRKTGDTRPQISNDDMMALNPNRSNFEGKSGLIEMTLNHMNQGVAVVRPDGRFWFYNRRALFYTGVSEENLPFPPHHARCVRRTNAQ